MLAFASCGTTGIASPELIGPNTTEVLDWLRRAPLDAGVAAEFVDGSGRATGNGGDAVLSGMVAYMSWYAVHALGAKL